MKRTSTLRLWLPVAIWLSLSGCVAEPINPFVFDDAKHKEILGPPISDVASKKTEMLALDPAIQDFIGNWIHPDFSPQRKLSVLRHILFAEDALGVTYDNSRTFTAAQTFENRRGNCISLTSLFIAMARSVGLDASFQMMAIRPTWNLSGKSMIWNEHINAHGRLRGRLNYVLDFLPRLSADAQDGQQRGKIVTDDHAQALFYSNLGAEAMIRNELDNAQRYLRVALAIKPGLSDAWNNMGSVQRRRGRQDLAEYSFLKANQLNPKHYASMSNLARLYRSEGQLVLSRDYEERVARFRRANPYYRIEMARIARTLERPDIAIKHLKKATRLKPKEPLFHFALHQVYSETGQQKKAAKHLAKAKILEARALQLDSDSSLRIYEI